MTTPVFITGFENGVATPSANGGGLWHAINGSPSVQGTTKNTGSYALQCNPRATTAYVEKTFSGQTTVVGRVYFRYGTLPNSRTEVIMHLGGTISGPRFMFLNTDSKIYVAFGSTGGTASSSTVTTNTWYRLDYRIVILGSLSIYDPSTAPGGFVRFKQVLSNFERRLQRLPLFRTRLVEVPLGLDRPYWVLDPGFDVEFHIRHIALPHPGDWRQLCILVARLHARPLDMARPLWEAYIIEGLDRIPDLPRGSFAIFTKMHHSLVDGAGGQSFMSALHDLEPVPSTPSEFEEVRQRFAELQPSDIRLLGTTLLKLPGP